MHSDIDVVATIVDMICNNIDNHEDLRRINTAAKMRWNELSNAKKLEFHIGDKVKFKDRAGKLIFGVVQKINRAKIQVKPVASLTIWHVAPTLLQHWEAP